MKRITDIFFKILGLAIFVPLVAMTAFWVLAGFAVMLAFPLLLLLSFFL